MHRITIWNMCKCHSGGTLETEGVANQLKKQE